MIKCVDCGKELKEGAPRYSTPVGPFCCDCWKKRDKKFKDDMLKQTLSKLAAKGERFLNAINGKGGKR